MTPILNEEESEWLIEFFTKGAEKLIFDNCL